jgi:hypothetical protein
MHLPVLLTDRTALLGTTAAVLAGLDPLIITSYLGVRLLLPVLLIVYAAHGATPAQRIALVRAYLLHQPTSQPPAAVQPAPTTPVAIEPAPASPVPIEPAPAPPVPIEPAP